MNQQKQIGIFQAEWFLQIHTVNTAIALAESGFCIDLFLYKTEIYTDLEPLKKNPNINIYIFNELLPRYYKQNHTFLKIANRILNYANIYSSHFRKSENRFLPCFIPYYVRQEVSKLIRQKRYYCLIGVEKLGLVWAGDIANKIGVPYIYHSLELYTRDHPFYSNNQSLKKKLLKNAEEAFHKKSSATIIQDFRRAEVLLRDNKIQKANTIYLPISLLGGPYKNKFNYLQNRFNLKSEQTVILQFGMMRFGIELAQVSQSFPEEWCLVLHDGFASNNQKVDFFENFKKIDINARTIVSLDSLSSEQIKQLIASAHIGLVLYSNSCKNDELTIFSSEKLALYLQCGIPIIAFNYPGYELLEQCQCGVLIKALSDLPNAINRILNDYGIYSSNAHKTFREYYSFEKNFNKLLEAVNHLT